MRCLRVPLALVLATRLTFGANVSNFRTTPSAITFTSSDPDTLASGTASQVTWSASGGNNGLTWTLSVAAAATTLTNCPRVPASAVQVRCTNGSVSGGSGTANCGGAITLSTTPQQIASGREGSNTRTYQVNVSMTFTDSWAYQATGSSCAASLTYTVNVP